MEKCEALIIKKSVYKESDYLTTLFTKKHGKVKALARNAKKSRKRFGGRLEPFLVLNVDISFNKNRFNVLNYVTLVSSYPNIMGSVESFLIANFVLEHLDIFACEGQSNEELFNETVKTFERMNKGHDLFLVLLNFQLNLLEISGIKPDFNECSSDAAIFDIVDGYLHNKAGRSENERYRLFHTDIITRPELMEVSSDKVVHNVKVLTGYIEYHAERKFKSSEFLGELSF